MPIGMESRDGPLVQKRRNTALGPALKDFFDTIAPVAPQFALITLLTMGLGAVNKLTFDAQAVMAEDTFANKVTDETTNQYKFIAFGFSKALANVLGAVYADKLGKTPVLVVGWCCGLVHAGMVLTRVFELTIWSNVALGFMQGACWSLMIFYMIDYAGPNNRALAVGLNETVGYTAMAVFGKVGPLLWATEVAGRGEDSSARGDASGAKAASVPYYGILAFSAVGLLVSVTGVLRDNRAQVVAEQRARLAAAGVGEYTEAVTYTFPSGRTKSLSVFRFAFVETSFLNNSLMACCLAGVAINYTTTFAWGLAKTWAKAGGAGWGPIDPGTADDITLTYDLTKGMLQFVFGFYSDRVGRRALVVGGLGLISAGLVLYAVVGGHATSTGAAASGFFVCSFILGLGTAMMYAIVIAAVGESADPSWRSSAVGSYRFWRDSGYSIGGLLLGYSTDQGSYETAVVVTACVLLGVTATFYWAYEEVPEDALDLAAINKRFIQETASDGKGGGTGSSTAPGSGPGATATTSTAAGFGITRGEHRDTDEGDGPFSVYGVKV